MASGLLFTPVEDTIVEPLARKAAGQHVQAAVILKQAARRTPSHGRTSLMAPTLSECSTKPGSLMTRRRLPFTPEDSIVIREMRAAGASWRAIGIQIGKSHLGCQRYWVRVFNGATGWARPRGQIRAFTEESVEQARERSPVVRSGRLAMRAGNLLSWHAITVGTVLEGADYEP